MPIHLEMPIFTKSLICIAVVLLFGCSSRDENMEQTLSKKLIELRQIDVESLDLRTVIGKDWEKICLQGPYMQQDNFENMVGMKVRGFEYASDDVYIFWVFYQDGTYRWAKILRWEVMDKYWKKGTWCTGFASPYLYFGDTAGRKNYYLLDEKFNAMGVK